MADPLSVAASIAGIVSLGIQVSSGLFQFCQSVRDAPEDLETIHSDLLALCKILEEVQELSKPGKGKLQAGTTAHAVHECARIFNILQAELEKSSKQLKVKQGRAGKFILSKVERVGYFYRKSGLEKLRQDILHAKMTLMLAITVAEAYGRSKSEKGMDAREKFQLYATILSLQEKMKGQEKKYKVHQGGNQPTGDKGLDHIDSDGSAFGQFSSGSFFALTPSIPPVTPPSPTPNVPKPFQDSGKPDEQPTTGQLQAWISKFHVDSSNTALNCVVEPVNLPPDELFSWVKNKHHRDHDDSQRKQQQAPIGEDALQPPPVLDVLAGLGNGPRSMILSHITSFGGSATLLAVQPCSPFSMPTPFGDMELQPFMWVTLGGATAARDDQSKVERARRAEEEAKKKIEHEVARRDKVEREGMMVKTHGEAEEAKRMAEEEEKAEERRKAEEERMEAELRGRLSKFGFQENQVMAMVKPGKAQQSTVASISPPDAHQRPTYVKVHRDHLSTETLAYYGLPWEFDRVSFARCASLLPW
ncbi:hypothetical protein MPH_05160 [Macrophomina phaseolina MS6]|uniref:Azaphilone pigments biosynthesis cluster protein L N-terminal domain-containing protein n=1 Tax=Macrophomina phaseolina (strain MS6) TaxID=1126212 RepID=K2R5Q3_MACPH|nr:hypothetical protein MPH_05160 [Macrophomina phaseolina MS6]